MRARSTSAACSPDGSSRPQSDAHGIAPGNWRSTTLRRVFVDVSTSSRNACAKGPRRGRRASPLSGGRVGVRSSASRSAKQSRATRRFWIFVPSVSHDGSCNYRPVNAGARFDEMRHAFLEVNLLKDFGISWTRLCSASDWNARRHTALDTLIERGEALVAMSRAICCTAARKLVGRQFAHETELRLRRRSMVRAEHAGRARLHRADRAGHPQDPVLGDQAAPKACRSTSRPSAM